jgi:hypothetical protein
MMILLLPVRKVESGSIIQSHIAVASGIQQSPVVPDVVTTFPASGMIQSQLREKRSVLKVVAVRLTRSYL